MPEPIDYTKNKESQVHHTSGRYSGIQFVDDKQIDSNGSQTPKDRSFSYWGNSWKTFIKLFQGNIFYNASGNISLNAGEEVHLTAHNKQETTSGGSAVFNKGETVHNHGDMSEEQKANMKQFHDYQDQITQAAQDKWHNTQGEQVQCQNCAQQHLVDDKSDNWTTIFGSIQDTLGTLPYYCLGFGAVEWFVKNVYCAIPGIKTNQALNNGEGCGPGCKNGVREGMSLKMQASEKAVKEEMDRLQDKMNKITMNLKNSSATAKTHVDSEFHIYGDPTAGPPKIKPYMTHKDHHSLPTNLRVSDTLRNKLRVTTEGNCKKIVYQPPTYSPYGNLMLQIQNNLKITAGNAGMDFMSTGEIAVKGGSVHINGSEGEVSLTSQNLTTIGGGTVLIAANNQSGDTGVCIDSKYTYIRGSFNVNGDTAMLGGLTVDGPLSVTHMNYPTMSTPSQVAADSKWATEGANWDFVGVGLNDTNLTKDSLLKYNPILGGMLMTEAGITSITMEMFNIIMMSRLTEFPIPTGKCLAGGIGACVGIVWNFTHNHTTAGHDHEHMYDAIQGNMYRTKAGAGNQRVAGNPAPTPAPATGTFASPGPKALHGGCGGGGLFKKVRNQMYGIDSEEAFDGNHVTTTVVRNPDGSIYPDPDLTYRIVHDCGSNKVVDKNTGEVTDSPSTTTVDCVD